jgi:hypothetical protein
MQFGKATRANAVAYSEFSPGGKVLLTGKTRSSDGTNYFRSVSAQATA